jgi:hypothetical protein
MQDIVSKVNYNKVKYRKTLTLDSQIMCIMFTKCKLKIELPNIIIK